MGFRAPCAQQSEASRGLLEPAWHLCRGCALGLICVLPMTAVALDQLTARSRKDVPERTSDSDQPE